MDRPVWLIDFGWRFVKDMRNAFSLKFDKISELGVWDEEIFVLMYPVFKRNKARINGFQYINWYKFPYFGEKQIMKYVSLTQFAG